MDKTMGECQEVAHPSKVLGESHCLQQREEQVKYSNNIQKSKELIR